MTATKAYAAEKAKAPLAPTVIERREPGPKDVAIEILYCGVCHSDVHQARDEWGHASFPMVPGHEIVGKVVEVGPDVKRFKVGDNVGVGCFIDSCRECSPCKVGIEQYCEKGMNQTYNGVEKDRKTRTFGGFSKAIVVDENYVLSIPPNLPLDKAAPLLCAGITTYSPLRHWKIKSGDKVAVVGLGGLGHMAVKFAAAMGAAVTVLSTSNKKKEDALRMGATQFANTTDPNTFKQYANYFHFIINTAAANMDINPYFTLLKLDGTMVNVGVPEKPLQVNPIALIFGRKRFAGSLIGGIKETQEMLDYCALKNVTPDIEVIAINQINEAFDRMVKGDVHYRFVIDMKTLT